jgi:hypothetical protein
MPGLYPTSKEAVRVVTDDAGNVSVNPGPFEGPSLGGYGILNVASIDEAVELVKGFPVRQPGTGLEIRRIINIDDLPLPDEVKAKSKELRCVIGLGFVEVSC